MRWKLACGGVVGTTKQPLQYKDFDKIEISDNYADFLADNGTIRSMGRLPDPSEISINVRFSNPSTHTIRKSSYNQTPYLSVGVYRPGNWCSARYTDSELNADCEVYLSNLNYGSVITQACHPPIESFNDCYTWLINPLHNNWFRNDGQKDWLPTSGKPWNNYWGHYYSQTYYIKFITVPHSGKQPGDKPHTSRRSIAKIITYNIDYKVY